MEGVLRKFYHIPLWKGLHPTGSDNPLAFPKEEERDDGGAVLWRSILTSQAIIYGFINPEIITWADPEHKFNISTVCIQSVSIQNIQEQLLLTVSNETFLDPSNHEKLNLLSKERGIQEIMKNTLVDKDNNKVLVNYLYTEKLINLGENFFGTTEEFKRSTTSST